MFFRSIFDDSQNGTDDNLHSKYRVIWPPLTYDHDFKGNEKFCQLQTSRPKVQNPANMSRRQKNCTFALKSQETWKRQKIGRKIHSLHRDAMQSK